MKISSHSVSDTLKIGKLIAVNLRAADIICLFGELGCGKTVLTKGIALGLGIPKNRIISPTFVFIRQHRGKIPFFHFDLYRVKNPREIINLGYEEYFYDEAVTVVEWADRLGCLTPQEYLKIELFLKANQGRELVITAIGKHYQELLSKINEDIKHRYYH